MNSENRKKRWIFHIFANLLIIVMTLVMIEVGMQILIRVENNRQFVRSLKNFSTYKANKQLDEGFWVKRFIQQYEQENKSIAGGDGTQLEPHRDLGWVARKNLKQTDKAGNTYTTNSQGFRSLREYSAIDHEKYVVLVVGDSFTYGADADDSVAWPAIFQSLDPSLEVLNLGMPGYGTDQMYLLLQKYIAEFRPNLVIAAVYDEDVFRALLSFRSFQKPRYIVDNGELRLTNVPIGDPESVYASLKKEMGLELFWSNFRLVNFIQNTFFQLRAKLNKQPASLLKYGLLVDDEYKQLNEKILQGIRDVSQQHQADFMIAYVPAGQELIDKAYSSPIGDFLEEIAVKHVMHYCNPRQQFLDTPRVFRLDKGSMERLRTAKVPEDLVEAIKELKHQDFAEDEFWLAIEEQIGAEQTRKYKTDILASVVPQYRMGHYGQKEAAIFAASIYEAMKTLPAFAEYMKNFQ